MSIKNSKKGMDMKHSDLLKKVLSDKVILRGAHASSIQSNQNNMFHIELSDLELEILDEVYVILINEETKIRKAFSVRVLEEQILEFELDTSLFSGIEKIFDLQMWTLAIAYKKGERLHLKCLQNKKEKNRNTDIRSLLYRNYFSDQNSEVFINHQAIRVFPFYYSKGHISICTMSKKLTFYTDEIYGATDFFLNANNLTIKVYIPKDCDNIDKIFLLSKSRYWLETEQYKANYKMLSEDENGYRIECTIDLNSDFFYNSNWEIYIQFKKEQIIYKCPILIAAEKAKYFKKKKIDYFSEQNKFSIVSNISKFGLLSLECQMDFYDERAFILRNAQVTEQDSEIALKELLEEKSIIVRGSINAKIQGAEKKQITIQLQNETLHGCSDIHIAFLKNKDSEVMLSDKIVLSEKMNEISFEVPNFLQWLETFRREVSKICLIVKKDAYYYVLRFQDRVLDQVYRTKRKKKKEDCYYNKLDNYLQEIDSFHFEDIPISVIPFMANQGHMSIMTVEESNKYVCQIINEIKSIQVKNGILKVKAFCYHTLGELKGFRLAYRYKRREDKETYFIPATRIKKKRKYTIMEGSLNISEIDFHSIYWDVFGVFELEGKEYEFEFRTINLLYRLSFLRLINHNFYVNEEDFILFPYLTMKRSVALQFREKIVHDDMTFRLKERIALIAYFFAQFYLKRKKIILTYEKYSFLAQDNGFYFFKYCMDNNMEEAIDRKIYYVIDKASPDWSRVEPYEKNVLDFMSLKYMIYLLATSLMVSSDTKTHAYAWRCKGSLIYKILNNKKFVFLQHGVISFKKVDKVYAKTARDAYNLFIVSTDAEHDIIRDHFKYNEDEIATTGLARWDVLEDKSEGSKEILLMPTWRNWLDDIEEEIFIESDYYKNYTKLLSSERLLDILEKYDVTLNFYLHPKFMDYVQSFSSTSDRIRIIIMGEEPLNQLLMKSKMLITDYSSVAWDMYYQGKSVLFYQFDIDTYQEIHGSYIDFETELFGKRTEDLEELFTLIEESCENNFMLEEQYMLQRKKRFKYLDHNNSKRIFDAIIDRGL